MVAMNSMFHRSSTFRYLSKGALKNQVQHFWEIILKGACLMRKITRLQLCKRMSQVLWRRVLRSAGPRVAPAGCRAPARTGAADSRNTSARARCWHGEGEITSA